MSAPLRDAIRARVLAVDPGSLVATAGRSLAGLGGGEVAAVVFFGSRKTKPSADPWSAHDFFVVVRGYRPFYAALREAGQLHRSPGLVAALNLVMPPNQLALRPLAEQPAFRAKCAAISLDHLARETSRRRRDHFCAGRLFQPTEVVFRADAEAEARVLDAQCAAHQATWEWVRPWLPERFDADGYVETALRVSMAWEIRPEPSGRAEALFAAQRDYHRAVYPALLESLAARGLLQDAGAGRYRMTRPAGALERLRVTAYFVRSLARATARWPKYVLTFDDWLPYITHKAMRHSGQEIVLTEPEKRAPLVFLWPRLLRYLWGKDRKGRKHG